MRLTYWNRDVLMQNMATCGFTVGAELGVREGLSALEFCKNLPGLHLLCVDPWADWPQHKDMRRYPGEPLQFLAEAKERLSGYDCEFIQARSQDAVVNVPDESLDFVYIDGDHTFDGTMLDLILWSPKVKKGGIVAGHDYVHHGYNGVIPAVNAYTAAHLVRDWYITNDRQPNYFWMRR